MNTNNTARSPFQTMMEAAERHGLYDIDSSLRTMAMAAGQNPGSLTDKVRQLFVQKVQQLMKALQTTGFFPAPANIISNGTFTLGTANGVPFRLTHYELCRHVCFSGPSGSGKTSALQPVALQCRASGAHLVIPDYKDDFTWLAAQDADFLILHPDVPLNILDHPSYVERAAFIASIVNMHGRATYGGEHHRQVSHETLWEAYRRYQKPSIMDWYHTVKERINPRDTYQRRDAYNGLLARLTRFIEQFPGMARTRDGIKHDDLWKHSIYLGGMQQSDTTEFLTAWIMNSYFLAARHHQARNTLRYLMVLDEGLLTFGEGNRIDGPVMLPLIPLLREYGAAIAIATAHLGGIHEVIRANVYTTIQLPLGNATEVTTAARTLGLSPEQTPHLLALQPGQAIVRTGKWRLPFRIEFPPLPYEKTVTSQQWGEAIERTNRLAPTTITPNITTTQFVAAAPAQISSAIASETAPVAEIKPLALNAAETALLRIIKKESIITVSDAYKKANLKPQQGDRASRKAETLGLITKTPIVVSPGTGGTGKVLQLTKSGEELPIYDGIPKTHGLRGGSSPQHDYLVWSLAKHLTGSSIETTLGGTHTPAKSIDLLFRATTENKRVLQAIAHNAHYLCDHPAAINDAELIAIEVETSDARKTAPANATADLNVGVAIVVIATMPKSVEIAKRALLRELPTAELPRVIVTDALSLFSAIQEAS